jgi:hypothetical protein
MTINLGRHWLDRRILRGIIAAGALLGLMATAPSAFASRCRQPGHIWYGPNPVPQFGQIFLTGVTCPNTPARFIFRDGAGNIVWDPVTQRSRDNCVIHHEPEFRTVHLPPGNYFVVGQFWDEFCNFKVSTLPTFTVTRAACHVNCDQGTLDPDTCSCQCFEGADLNCWSQGGNWDSSTCTCRYFEPLRPEGPGPAEPRSVTPGQP